jgi:hypothetical protein
VDAQAANAKRLYRATRRGSSNPEFMPIKEVNYMGLTLTAAPRPLPDKAEGTTGEPAAFRAGDKVVLADGPYKGTPGVFLQFREDVNWADITESNGVIRSHPSAWLTRRVVAAPVSKTPGEGS